MDFRDLTNENIQSIKTNSSIWPSLFNQFNHLNNEQEAANLFYFYFFYKKKCKTTMKIENENNHQVS